MKVNMRILVVSQYYHPESFSITNLCEGLVRLGHHVQVVTSKPQYGFGQIPKDYQKITDEIVSGVNIHRVNTYPQRRSWISFIRNYVTFYRSASKDIMQLKGRYDVVMSVSLSPIMSIIPAIRYAKTNGIPHLLYAIDVWPESFLVNKFFRKEGWIYRWLTSWSHSLYRQVDKILVGSASYQPHFTKLFGKEKVIPEAMVQPALIEEVGQESIQYGEGFHLVYAGNFGIIHQLASLIKAWASTPANMHLHCIGSGQQSQPLHQLVKELLLEDRVHFYAHQTPENLGKFLIDADAFYVGLQTPGIVGKSIPQALIQYLPFGQPILAYLQGDGLALSKTLPPTFLLEPGMKNLSKLLMKIKKLTDQDREKIKIQHQTYYQEHFANNLATKTLERHFKSLIQVTKS
jgi:glycosyltransferase involved in cell wall biosynthesis